MGFRSDFLWGSATSSYQIEGAYLEDGKGLNIWDVFSKEKGKIYDNQNGDVACDHYHRYKEDVRLMKELHMQTYRFSIDWARILPEGTGKVNQKGIDFYNNLIDELLANDIIPFITLYHWELPYALHQQGGWKNPKISDWFAEYAKVVAENFSDRVKHFFTLNEPQCTLCLGYELGYHAPGYRVNERDFFRIAHNLLLAHGKAVMALRKYGKQDLLIGYAPTATYYCPSSDSKEDIELAKRGTFDISSEIFDKLAWDVTFMTDPIVFGKYPDKVFELYGEYLPEITEEDMKVISQPIDFQGINLYNGKPIRLTEDGRYERPFRYAGFPRTSQNWPVTPNVMYWATKFMYERYHLPIYITENGMSAHDWVHLDGKVHDPNRIDFYQRYLLELEKSANEGNDIAGFFAWSLLDNFEWADGYKERFGLIYVDYRTQERTIKDSGYWYRDIIDSNGEKLHI